MRERVRVTEFHRSRRITGLEARSSCQENSCYRLHFHETFSIGLIDKGTSILSGALEGPIRLKAGDTVLIPAGHVHACNPEKGQWLYHMIHTDQNWAHKRTRAGVDSDVFSGIRVLRSPSLPGLVRELSRAIFDDEPATVIEAYADELFQTMEAVPPVIVAPNISDVNLARRLEPVMTRLRNEQSAPLLDDLAEEVHMSKYQLVRAMRKATGLTPVAWRHNARVIQARHLLREGQPISQIAHVLGFADQSHFHRVFRSYVAASPGSYRASMQ